ncbi:hypothetical protein SE18_17200 [Herpetosiphon geysericola]|uniref:Uncharacterized protein n=1 Tax=Herpetosiphon geysericola TaxID=70996 RepID=A0A0P6XZB8_9CHLR|nr:hypothetical protein SE18_17200 [Herpetosiphon geysericola]
MMVDNQPLKELKLLPAPRSQKHATMVKNQALLELQMPKSRLLGNLQNVLQQFFSGLRPR